MKQYHVYNYDLGDGETRKPSLVTTRKREAVRFLRNSLRAGYNEACYKVVNGKTVARVLSDGSEVEPSC